MLREWEGDLIWGYVGIRTTAVRHLRLGFYQGSIFTEAPKRQRDVRPILHLLEELQPTVVTVALDPEGTGPDTHYKVLQAVAAALREYVEHHEAPTVWGYRNVWYHFRPEEATLYVPTTLNTMAVMENAFLNCFGSQKDASFPSPDYDGPFCYVAQHRWIEQFETVKTCLGEEFFRSNPIPQLRAVRGLVFLKELTVEEFLTFAAQARSVVEDEG
jgi:glucosamine-6-phosphate deaminase